MFFTSIEEINTLRKEIYRLLSKGVSNIYLKITKEKFSKLRFSGFKRFVTRSVFGELQLKQISLNFKTSCFNLKIRSLGAKFRMAFLFFFTFERNYEVLKSKSPWILLNKYINFNKNKTKLKMENPTYSFREANLVLQLINEFQIKSKTVRSWSSQKKKDGSLFYPRGILFNICVLFQCIMY